MIRSARTTFPSPILFALSYTVLAAMVIFFLPPYALWDERLFYPEIERLSQDWPGLQASITGLQSPMGPLYFWVYALFAKISDNSWILMRILHLWLSGILLLQLATYLSGHRYSWITWLAFLCYPYFLVMCGPLLYTDVLGLLLCYGGIRLYYEKKSYLLAGLLWGLALWTRQLFIIIPLSAGISALLQKPSFSTSSYFSIAAPLLAGLLFLPLYLLWGDVNSGNFPDGMYAENSLAAFRFTLQDLNYSLALVGLWTIPALIIYVRKIHWKIYGICFLFALILTILAVPTQVNADMTVGNLPATAGLLDIALSMTSYAAYPLAAGLIALALYLLYSSLNLLGEIHVRFLWIAIILFILLEASYSYCWDKHTLLVAPIILYLSMLRFSGTENIVQLTSSSSA